MCPKQVFFTLFQTATLLIKRGDLPSSLLSRPYMGEDLTLPSSESSKNLKNGISMQEVILSDKFCASRGTRFKERPLKGAK